MTQTKNKTILPGEEYMAGSDQEITDMRNREFQLRLNEAEQAAPGVYFDQQVKNQTSKIPQTQSAQDIWNSFAKGNVATFSGGVGGASTPSQPGVDDATANQTLGELGLNPQDFGLDGVTEQTTLREAMELRHMFTEAFEKPGEAVEYSKRIAALDSKARVAGEDLRQKTTKFAEADLKLKKREQELKNLQYVEELGFAQEVQNTKREKLQIAENEAARIEEINNETKAQVGEYTAAIKTAFKMSEDAALQSKPGVLASVGGTLGFTDNDGFSWEKTASTMFWLAGVFGNTFLSIGTEGKIPNYFLDAFFKAVNADGREKAAHARKISTYAARAKDGLNATIEKFTVESTQEQVKRGALLRQADAYLDTLAANPKLIEFSKNPIFQKALNTWKDRLKYEEHKTNLAVSKAIRDQVISETSSRAGILGQASAAQHREFLAKSQKASLLKSMLAGKDDKIFELSNKDQEFYGNASKIQNKVQEGLAVLKSLRDAPGAKATDKFKQLWARMGYDKYFNGASGEEYMNKIGLELGRMWARTYDTGNLSQSEQEFGAGMAFQSGDSLAYIERVLRTFESEAVNQTMGRYMRTIPQKRDILRPWMTTMGIRDPEKIAEAMIRMNISPTEVQGAYDTEMIQANHEALVSRIRGQETRRRARQR